MSSKRVLDQTSEGMLASPLLGKGACSNNKVCSVKVFGQISVKNER